MAVARRNESDYLQSDQADPPLARPGRTPIRRETLPLFKLQFRRGAAWRGVAGQTPASAAAAQQRQRSGVTAGRSITQPASMPPDAGAGGATGPASGPLSRRWARAGRGVQRPAYFYTLGLTQRRGLVPFAHSCPIYHHPSGKRQGHQRRGIRLASSRLLYLFGLFSSG